MKANSLKKVSILISLILIISFISMSTLSAAQWTVGPGKNYNTIQEAVDNGSTHDGDVITVYNGTYSEDVVVNKRLTIQSNDDDNVELQPTNTGFILINDSIGDASGSLIKGFKITGTGIGINVTVNNCKIENNRINGGIFGISTIGNSTIIKGNVISNILNNSIQIGLVSIMNSSGNISITSQSPFYCIIQDNNITGGITGISAASNNITVINNLIKDASGNGIEFVGSYPTIVGNKILDMVSIGAKKGITIAALTLNGTTGLNLTGNIISNINSTNNTTTAIDVFAMTLGSTLDSILVSGNTLSDIYGIGSATALSFVALAVDGDISSMIVTENNFSNVKSQGINSTSKGIDFLAMALSGSTNHTTTSAQNLTIYKNNITGINSQGSNSSSLGISFLALSKGNSSISGNNLSNINSELSSSGIVAIGVDFSENQTGNRSNILLDKNIISNINAINTTTGIVAIIFGNIFISHNSIFNLNSEKSKYILTNVINKTDIKGNNLEGNAAGEGIAVRGNDTTINYNRIVNFDHYIQNINYTEFWEVLKGPLPTDEQIAEYLRTQNWSEQNITDFLVFYHKTLNELDGVPSNTNATYNWYGTNDPPSSKFLPGNGTLVYFPWLVLNIRADPSTINVGQTSKITADVYRDSSGGDHSMNANQFFSGPRVTFATDLGNVGSKSSTVLWVNGLSMLNLIANDGAGIARVSATDYQTVWTLVKIIGGSKGSQEVINAAMKTIGMQNTGIPLQSLLLAILMLFSGLIISRKS